MLNACADDIERDTVLETSPKDASLKQKYPAHNIENRQLLLQSTNKKKLLYIN